MGDLTDPDDCDGVEGVIVRITDANLQVHELTTHAAGNFFLLQAIPTPCQAELEVEGDVIAMANHPDDGACNHCHAERPKGGAPGRIVLP
jgi:hypothetical protein